MKAFHPKQLSFLKGAPSGKLKAVWGLWPCTGKVAGKILNSAKIQSTYYSADPSGAVST